MPQGLTIGQLAKAAEVNVETIRYYQRRRLLPQPGKPAGGFRRYSPALVRRVRFIKRAQAIGFTLQEIASLLSLDDAHACAETRALAARKLASIDRKLADLAAMREALAGLVRQCDSAAGASPCPIIGVLDRD
jgi:MerR family mercuric resistance operon transcriptional regulator